MVRFTLGIALRGRLLSSRVVFGSLLVIAWTKDLLARLSVTFVAVCGGRFPREVKNCSVSSGIGVIGVKSPVSITRVWGTSSRFSLSEPISEVPSGISSVVVGYYRGRGLW